MHKTPRILVLDIETAPLLANVWKIFKENIGVNQLEESRKCVYILSFSAKWLGDDKIEYMDQRKARDPENDLKLVQRLIALIDQADLTLTHNGKDFDHRVINTRIAFHRLHKPTSYRMIDTLVIARRNLMLPSYKLEYLTELYNKKYKKLKHKDYPGFELWKACLAGDQKAWKEMEKYNKHDVLALEELYVNTLRVWDDQTNYFIYQDEIHCRCGSDDFVKQGWHYNQTRKYQRYKCKDCGYEWRDAKAAACVSVTSTVTR